MDKILLPVLLIIVSFGLFFSYTLPTYKASKLLQEQEALVAEALVSSEKIDEMRIALKSDIAALPPEDMRRLATILPESIDITRYVIRLSDLAVSTGMELLEMEVPEQELGQIAGGSADSEVIETLDFTFELTGSYEGFRSFLQKLEKDIYIKDIIELSISSADTSDEVMRPEKFTYTVLVRTYLFL